MAAFNIIQEKVVYYDSPKCGSTTVLAYANLINNPELLGKMNSLIEQGLDPMAAYNKCVKSDKQKYSRDAISSRILISKSNVPQKSVKFCVVRDPIDRFISVYKALILNGWLVKTDNPSVDEFIRIIDLDKQSLTNWKQIHPRGWNVIKFHFFPLTKLLGKNPEKFDHIFNVNQLTDVKNLLELHSNLKLPTLRLNGTPDTSINLTDDQIGWIKNRYSEDYRCYGKWM